MAIMANAQKITEETLQHRRRGGRRSIKNNNNNKMGKKTYFIRYHADLDFSIFSINECWTNIAIYRMCHVFIHVHNIHVFFVFHFTGVFFYPIPSVNVI